MISISTNSISGLIDSLPHQVGLSACLQVVRGRDVTIPDISDFRDHYSAEDTVSWQLAECSNQDTTISGDFPWT